LTHLVQTLRAYPAHQALKAAVDFEQLAEALGYGVVMAFAMQAHLKARV
jgi:hypothetical protein